MTHNTTPAETQEIVAKKILQKGKKAIEKKNSALKTLTINYVSVDAIRPNSYNPNRQSEHDFELLCKSMEEDGFTQPIVCVKVTQEMKDEKDEAVRSFNVGDIVIVDGEHRWRAAKTLGYKEIPVAFAPMSLTQARIATLRHNKARGSHDMELEVQVLRDLQALGALDWAQDSLMLDDEEINRLLEDIPAPEALAGEDYGQSWVVTEHGKEDRDIVESGSTEGVEITSSTHGGKHITAMTQKAIEDIRDREKRIAQARTDEERKMAQQQTKLFRVSVIFSNEEAELVEKVLGKEPAVKILELCKNAV